MATEDFKKFNQDKLDELALRFMKQFPEFEICSLDEWIIIHRDQLTPEQYAVADYILDLWECIHQ